MTKNGMKSGVYCFIIQLVSVAVLNNYNDKISVQEIAKTAILILIIWRIQLNSLFQNTQLLEEFGST